MKTLYELKVEAIWGFHEHLAAFGAYTRQGTKYGFVNKRFDVVIDPMYDKVSDFSQGLSAVKVGDVCGYIDKKGQCKIPFEFWDAMNFSGGLAAVCERKASKYGYINKKGFYGIPPMFQLAFDFHNGIAIVVLDNKFFAINKKGKLISKKLANFTML